MSNLWETLDPDQQNELVRAHVAGNGGATPENINRAKEQLINNPTLVERLAKENGITSEDEELQDGEDVAEEVTAEQVAEDSLVDEGNPETPGSLPKTLPPPEEGEDVQAYYNRVSAIPPRVRGYDDVTPIEPAPEEMIAADVKDYHRRGERNTGARAWRR